MEEAVNEGKVSKARIDEACRRVLEMKYKLGLFENPYKYCNVERAKTETYSEANRAEARRIATETFVLMKNEKQLLPLAQKGRIALIGPMADAANNMSGMWSPTCDPSKHASLLERLRAATEGKAEILYAKGSNVYYDERMEAGAIGGRTLQRGDNQRLYAEAMAVASRADVVVAAVGECAEMTGESASRTDIRIPDRST